MKISQENAFLVKKSPSGCGARRLSSEFRDKSWKLGSIDSLLKTPQPATRQQQTVFGA